MINYTNIIPGYYWARRKYRDGTLGAWEVILFEDGYFFQIADENPINHENYEVDEETEIKR